ncbi:MAG: response regulator [Ktedonobacteraceae bacterium]
MHRLRDVLQGCRKLYLLYQEAVTWGLYIKADLIDGHCHRLQVNGSASYCSTSLLCFWTVRGTRRPANEEVMIGVLLVDDQPAVRRGLRMRLQLEPDMQIVGEASNGKEALNMAQTLAPDVVLMDVEMPEMDGIEATAALHVSVSSSAVVILSIHDDAQTRGRAQAAGAVAFVEKRGFADHLLAAIRQAARHA